MGIQLSPIQSPSEGLGFSDDKIRFVWCSDVHITGHFDAPANNLRLAVADCNVWRPNAFVMTGDVGDVTFNYLQRVFYITWACNRPVRLALGNHDEEENTLGAGNPNTAMLEGVTALNRPAPFYWSEQWSSGDGTITALALYLDCNFYADDPDAPPPGNSAYHEPGDRIGFITGMPSGGYWTEMPQAELDWIVTTLAADTSDMVLVFMHLEAGASRMTNFTALADALQTDPLARPLVLFSGHNHDSARTQILLSATNGEKFTTYKIPAMSESGAWARVTLSVSGGALVVDGMELHNYTDPGGWTVGDPFTTA